jgi:hypothetical protein
MPDHDAAHLALGATTLASSKVTNRGDQRKKHQHESRRGLFSRMYGGSKSGVQTKQAESSGDEGSYEFNNMAVDYNGLPLTSSDLHLAVRVSQGGLAKLDEAEKVAQEEQVFALSLLYDAADIISGLPYRGQQRKCLYDDQSHNLDYVPHRDVAGLTTLEELNTLRLAVSNIAEAYTYADPSQKGRLARKSTPVSALSECDRLYVPSVKRKPVPRNDEVDSIGAPSSDSQEEGEASKDDLEQGEELASYDSPLVKTQSPQARDVYQARSLRKLEVDRVSPSSEEYSEEEENTIAQYYIAKHRASRKNDVQHAPNNVKRARAIRRSTSILDSKDEMKKYLLKSGAVAHYQYRDKADFLKGLNDAPRHASVPPVPTIKPEFLCRAEDTSSSNEGGHSPESMAMSASTLSSDSMMREGSTTPPTSDINESPFSRTSTLSTSPSSRPSSSCFTSDEEERETPSSKGQQHQLSLHHRPYSEFRLAKLDFQPSRPKRHPCRGKAGLNFDRRHGGGGDMNAIRRVLSPSITGGDLDGSLPHCQSASSSDITPRPSALGFDPGLFCRLD